METNRTAPYAQLAVRFAEALVAGDFAQAYAMLGSGLRHQVSREGLRSNYETMMARGDASPTSIELIVTMEEWPDRRPRDLGWAYVAIAGTGYSEAVTVIVEQELDLPVIRHIEWGRP